MIPIKKGPAPAELAARVRELKATDGVVDLYAELREAREPVLRALVAEQGYLCAYCMRRIRSKEQEKGSLATIEHILPQHEQGVHHVDSSVDYRNILAVCDGHAGGAETTCDKHRGNSVLTVNPLKPETLTSIRYGSDGRIYADNESVNNDLDVTLNLNAPGTSLRENRKAVMDGINQALINRFKKLKGVGNRSRKRKICEELLRKIEGNGPERLEYISVARYVLERRMSRYSG